MWFSTNETIQLWGSPMTMETPICSYKLVSENPINIHYNQFVISTYIYYKPVSTMYIPPFTLTNHGNSQIGSRFWEVFWKLHLEGNLGDVSGHLWWCFCLFDMAIKSYKYHFFWGEYEVQFTSIYINWPTLADENRRGKDGNYRVFWPIFLHFVKENSDSLQLYIWAVTLCGTPRTNGDGRSMNKYIPTRIIAFFHLSENHASYICVVGQNSPNTQQATFNFCVITCTCGILPFTWLCW